MRALTGPKPAARLRCVEECGRKSTRFFGNRRRAARVAKIKTKSDTLVQRPIESNFDKFSRENLSKVKICQKRRKFVYGILNSPGTPSHTRLFFRCIRNGQRRFRRCEHRHFCFLGLININKCSLSRNGVREMVLLLRRLEGSCVRE